MHSPSGAWTRVFARFPAAPAPALHRLTPHALSRVPWPVLTELLSDARPVDAAVRWHPNAEHSRVLLSIVAANARDEAASVHELARVLLTDTDMTRRADAASLVDALLHADAGAPTTWTNDAYGVFVTHLHAPAALHVEVVRAALANRERFTAPDVLAGVLAAHLAALVAEPGPLPLPPDVLHNALHAVRAGEDTAIRPLSGHVLDLALAAPREATCRAVWEMLEYAEPAYADYLTPRLFAEWCDPARGPPGRLRAGLAAIPGLRAYLVCAGVTRYAANVQSEAVAARLAQLLSLVLYPSAPSQQQLAVWPVAYDVTVGAAEWATGRRGFPYGAWVEKVFASTGARDAHALAAYPYLFAFAARCTTLRADSPAYWWHALYNLDYTLLTPDFWGHNVVSTVNRALYPGRRATAEIMYRALCADVLPAAFLRDLVRRWSPLRALDSARRAVARYAVQAPLDRGGGDRRRRHRTLRDAYRVANRPLQVEHARGLARVGRRGHWRVAGVRAAGAFAAPARHRRVGQRMLGHYWRRIREARARRGLGEHAHDDICLRSCIWHHALQCDRARRTVRFDRPGRGSRGGGGAGATRSRAVVVGVHARGPLESRHAGGGGGAR